MGLAGYDILLGQFESRAIQSICLEGIDFQKSPNVNNFQVPIKTGYVSMLLMCWVSEVTKRKHTQS